MNNIIDPEGAIYQDGTIYKKLCCKCEKNYKYQRHFLGDYDLVLCGSCYINVLMDNKVITDYYKLIKSMNDY